MSFFFKQHPTIAYSNTAAVNIFTRPSLSELAKKVTSVYHPYTLKDGERPDHLAGHYYEDYTLSWLIYLTNNITDPYYQWCLSDSEFSEFIVSKYGSEVAAKQQIDYYYINWYGNESFLSVAAYQALIPTHRKYWSPTLTEKNVIRGYSRAPLDWAVDTNMIQQLSFSIANTVPEVGVRMTQVDGNNVVTAAGTVAHANSETQNLSLKHISGSFSNTVPLTSSGVSLDLLEINTTINNIPVDEQVYWQPKYAYDVEEELNQARRTVYVMDREFIPQIKRELERLF